jgi:hypothetical protein
MTNEIGKIINSIKCKDSSGYNEISSGILKISAPYVLSPNIHIQQNFYPMCFPWKI